MSERASAPPATKAWSHSLAATLVWYRPFTHPGRGANPRDNETRKLKAPG